MLAVAHRHFAAGCQSSTLMVWHGARHALNKLNQLLCLCRPLLQVLRCCCPRQPQLFYHVWQWQVSCTCAAGHAPQWRTPLALVPEDSQVRVGVGGVTSALLLAPPYALLQVPVSYLYGVTGHSWSSRPPAPNLACKECLLLFCAGSGAVIKLRCCITRTISSGGEAAFLLRQHHSAVKHCRLPQAMGFSPSVVPTYKVLCARACLRAATSRHAATGATAHPLRRMPSGASYCLSTGRCPYQSGHFPGFLMFCSSNVCIYGASIWLQDGIPGGVAQE